MPAFKLVCFLAVLATPTAAVEGHANPMEKVIELLGTLSKQIRLDGDQDAEAYEAHTDHYNHDKEFTEKVIKENEDTISRLESDLKEADAFREGKNNDLVDLANKLAKGD